MGLLSFFKRNSDGDRARGGSADAMSPDDVERARTRARRRLIGAIVLLGIGIIAFPLVFETQPRPVPVDLPIEIPRKDAVAPLALPPQRSASKVSGAVVAETPRDADKQTAAPAPASAPERPVHEKPAAEAPAPERHAAEKPAKPPAVAEAKPASRPVPDDAARAKALLEGKSVAKADASKAADEGSGRFVVQVGAFADAALARETRTKVEKLGLKTYTQVVETDAGKRIRVRVGPFGSRDEADKAAGRIKSAGMTPAVLVL